MSEHASRAVLRAVRKAFSSFEDASGVPPKIVDHGDEGTFVMWEEGPYEWTYCFPNGGRISEYGYTFEVPDVSHLIPKGVYAEAQNHYSVAITSS